MPDSCGASPVGPVLENWLPGMKFMYIVLIVLTPIPPGIFKNTIVFVAVLEGFISTHAWRASPVLAGPVVNLTLDQSGSM